MAKKTAIFSILIFFALISCKSGKPQKNTVEISENQTFSIVAVNFPSYDAVRSILGKQIENPRLNLKLLVKPGTEVHSYDPTPQDLIAIEKCDLFIFTGGESDEWIENLLEADGHTNSEKYFTLFDYVDLIEETHFDDAFDENGDENAEHKNEDDEMEDHKTHEHSHSHKNKHNSNSFEADEHVWTSPENEKKIVSALCKRISEIAAEKNLSQLIPEFKANTDETLQKIDQIALKTAEIVNAASEKLIVMADRFPLAYFTAHYGLSVDAAFSGCSTAVETSVAKIASLIELVRTHQLPAVFYIELTSHKIADIVAEETGVPALCLQSVQNVTKTDFENGETWISLMNRNAETLAKGLK